jgi:hypothetical protein
MSRRHFLGGALAAGTAVWIAPRLAGADGNAHAPLKGFIVSDAHFGWDNPAQPDPLVQREMMGRIVARFPDLDVFLDTGDAHHGSLHGNAGDTARAHWTSIIAEAGFTCPFFYVTGNHDGMSAHDVDSEWRCAELGSLVCRPYYSFTLAGIHFVSLPQLMRAVYLSREAMEWLALDLDIHRDAATVIFSHNNLIGTTGPVEPGYRGIVNGATALEAMDRHGKVLAWMHGHNHNYEVVPKNGRLYVSNGRIGGFDPSSKAGESHGLGGIYFEIDAQGMSVRSWSAEREAFLDEVGVDGVSGRVRRVTGLDRGQRAGYCYGFGGARDGMRVPVYHHVLGASRTLFMRYETPPLNDDPEIALYMARHDGKDRPPHKQLMGSDVLGENEHWDFADPGITLHARESESDSTLVTVPQRGMGQACYYAVAPGSSLEVALEAAAGEGGQRVRVEAEVFDRHKVSRGTIPVGEGSFISGSVSLAFEFSLPRDIKGTIYDGGQEDNLTHVMLTFRFDGLKHPITLRRIEITQTAGKTVLPALIVNGTRHNAENENGHFSAPMPPPATAREWVEVSSAARVSWLIRVDGAAAQTVNAPVCMAGGGRIRVGPLRNPWSEARCISIRSLEPPGHRNTSVTLRNIVLAELFEDQGALGIELLELDEAAEGIVEIVFTAGELPRNIEGAGDVIWEGNSVTLKRSTPGVITLRV